MGRKAITKNISTTHYGYGISATFMQNKTPGRSQLNHGRIDRWTLQDWSSSSPTQTNSYDCGLFTLAGITLLSQRIPLTPDSYSALSFFLRNMRQRIAYLLWKNSRNKPTVPAPRRRRSAQARRRQDPPKIHKKVISTKPSLLSKMTARARKERRKKYQNQR